MPVNSFLNYLYYGEAALKQVRDLKECLAWCELDEFYLLGGELKRLAELRLKESIRDNFHPLSAQSLLDTLAEAHQIGASAVKSICLEKMS